MTDSEYVLHRFKMLCKLALKDFRKHGIVAIELSSYYFLVPEDLTLQQVQHAFAVYYGFDSYKDFKNSLVNTASLEVNKCLNEKINK